MFSVAAPAKINLTLEVLGERPDGYHEVKTVVQTLNLADTILFAPRPDIEIHSSTPEWQAQKSLVFPAVKLLREKTGVTKGAAIGVVKNIPLMAGLGGDSSGAAAVLTGLNEFWGLNLPKPELAEIAAKLGSDVPLFLQGGTLLCTGRGENVTPLPSYRHLWVVILVPPIPREPGKTGRLYSALRPSQYTRGEMTEALINIITHDEAAELDFNEWGVGDERYTDHLFNVFENVAYDVFPGLAGYRQELFDAGAPLVHLAGTGPALFSLFQSSGDAENVFRRLREKGLECFLTSTKE